MSADKIDNWKKFYDLTAQVQENEPWLDLDDGQLVTLVHDSQEEPVFVNILGNAGNTYGLVFYKGLEGLNDYNLLRNCEDFNLPPTFGLFQQNCYCLYFGEEDEIPDEEYEMWQTIQPDFDDSEYGIPYVLSLKKGFFPWGPDDTEIQEIDQYLEWFLEVIDDVMRGEEWGVGMIHGICLCVRNPEDGSWDLSYPPFPDEDWHMELILPSDAYLQTELSHAEHSVSAYEIDIYYPMIHIDDPAYSRPAAAAFIIVADAGTGMIIDQKLMTPADEMSLEINDLLVHAAKMYGIPKQIHVRSEVFEDMLQETAAFMNSTVTVCDELENIDDLTEMMESGMLNPDMMFS